MDYLLIVALVAVCYLLDCWRAPWSDCWWCGGGSKRRISGRRSFRFCLWPVWLGGCSGSGRRRRLGSLLLRHGLGKLD